MKYVKVFKWLSVILVIAVMIPAIGCGKKEAQEPTPISTPAPTSIPNTTFEPTATSTTEPTAEPTSEPTPTPSQSSDTELQGTWTETLTDGGVSHDRTFTFSGNNWTATAGNRVMGTFILDSAANPKTIDLYFAAGGDPMYDPMYEGETWLGLYQLSGTNLTIAFANLPGDARPTAFTVDPYNLYNLVKQ
jgi:uncharacterized protein (TIGR03067 family)